MRYSRFSCRKKSTFKLEVARLPADYAGQNGCVFASNMADHLKNREKQIRVLAAVIQGMRKN